MSPAREEIEQRRDGREMISLRDEGKVRFLGMSGILPNLADHMRWTSSTFSRSPIQRCSAARGLIGRPRRGGAGVLVRGGVARGTASQDKNWRVRPFGGGDVPR